MSARCRVPLALAGAVLLTGFAGCAPHAGPAGRDAAGSAAPVPSAVPTPKIDAALAARLAANPDDVGARLALAEARRAAGDPEGALVETWKAIASDPKSEAAQIERARIYFDRGLADKEIEAWQAALALAPDDTEARENYGHALLAASRGKEAAEEYRRVLAARPDAKAALYNLAQLETDAGNVESARALWMRYLAVDASGAWAEKARAALAALPPRKAGP